MRSSVVFEIIVRVSNLYNSCNLLSSTHGSSCFRKNCGVSIWNKCFGEGGGEFFRTETCRCNIPVGCKDGVFGKSNVEDGVVGLSTTIVPEGCRSTDTASSKIGYSSSKVSVDDSAEFDTFNSKSSMPASKSFTSSSFFTVMEVFSDRMKTFTLTIQRRKKIIPTIAAIILHV